MATDVIPITEIAVGIPGMTTAVLTTSEKTSITSRLTALEAIITGVGFAPTYLVPFAPAPDNTDYTSSDTGNLVSAAVFNITLPAGTWSIFAMASVVASHSADGSVRTALMILADTGSVFDLPSSSQGPRTFTPTHSVTGVGGSASRAITVRYQPTAAGTVTVQCCSLIAVAIRTA